MKGRRRYRAGVVAPMALLNPPDSLSANASCRTTRLGDLWWRTTSSLCLSNGARLLYDLQHELGIASQFQQPFWGRDLLQMLQAGILSANPAFRRVDLPPDTATVVPREWILLAVWYTYHRAEFASFNDVITLPPTLSLPLLGATGASAIPGYSTSSPETRCLAGFTRELPLRPTATEGPEGYVVGSPPAAKSSKAWAVLAGLGVLAIVLGSR